MHHRMTGYALFCSAALASASLAQGVMTFSWQVGDSGDNDGVIVPGETAVVTLYASWDPRQVGYAGSIFDIVGNADWQLGAISSRENLVDSLGSGPGTLNGDNSITGIESFQLPPFFNPQFRADHPIAIYRLEWTPQDYRVYWVEFTSANHLNASVYTDDFGTSQEYDIVISGGRIAVLPAPMSGAVLALGLVTGSRRTR